MGAVLDICAFAESLKFKRWQIEVLIQTVIVCLFLVSKDVPSDFLPMILDEYLGDTEDPAELRDGFLDLLGDMAIVMPAIKALNYHRGKLTNSRGTLKPPAAGWIK